MDFQRRWRALLLKSPSKIPGKLPCLTRILLKLPFTSDLNGVCQVTLVFELGELFNPPQRKKEKNKTIIQHRTDLSRENIEDYYTGGPLQLDSSPFFMPNKSWLDLNHIFANKCHFSLFFLQYQKYLTFPYEAV